LTREFLSFSVLCSNFRSDLLEFVYLIHYRFQYNFFNSKNLP
jgi:hypothetical protein